MRYQYKTKGTCSTQVSFDLDGDVVHNVSFQNGCPGNLLALSSLAEGMTVSQLEQRLCGIQCGIRGTSCADQFSKALRKGYEESRKNTSK